MGKLFCQLFPDGKFLRSFYKEPLFHFALIGVALFLLYRGVAQDPGSERVIVVAEPAIAALAQRYNAVWMRPPTATELDALIAAHIKEEILYRQGVVLGLDRNDKVIQRRVLQKLEVLAEEANVIDPPSDEELTEYLGNHAERYAKPTALDFRQIVFDPTRYEADFDGVFDNALTKLRAGADPALFGSSTLLPATASDVSIERIAREFGNRFAEAVAELPVGIWQGPVESGFGVHIVLVEERVEGQDAMLSEVRTALERDWEGDRRSQAAETYYQSLLETYDVRIETGTP
jgi:hypothetical protein